MKGERSGLQVLLEVSAILVAVAVQVLGELYLTDADFRYRVDVAGGRVRHWFRRKRWEAHYAALPGWKQEAIEQVHGKQ